MAANQIIVGVQNATDGQVIQARGGHAGETIVQTLRGQYAEVALRGQVYSASTAIAGVVVPVAAANLSSVYMLWNPAGSGVNVELISAFMAASNATTVAGVHGLMIQRPVSTSGGVPTSISNPFSIFNKGPGSAAGRSVCTVAGTATLTNAAIPGALAQAIPIEFYPMGGYGAVTNGGTADMTHNFMGKIILPPDSLVSFCTSRANATASVCQLVWAEFSA